MMIPEQDLENNIQQTQLFKTTQVFMFGKKKIKISQIFVTFVSMISANSKIANLLSLLSELTPTSTV